MACTETKDQDAPKVCETLSQACGMVLKLTVAELERFKPRTVSEKIALQYVARANRGDDKAFDLLTATADTAVVDESFEDDFSKAMEEFAREMVDEYREKHSE